MRNRIIENFKDFSDDDYEVGTRFDGDGNVLNPSNDVLSFKKSVEEFCSSRKAQ